MGTQTQYITNPDGTKSKVVTKSPDPRQGAAWVKSGNSWKRPKKPKGDYAWDDDKGWISKDAAATDYGYPLAIINSDKELTQLFNEAWASMKKGEDWTEAEFKVKLQRTDWFKTQSEAQQKFYVLSKDPAQKAEFNAQVTRNKSDIRAAAEAMGATLTEAQLDKVTRDNLMYGWNPSQLEDFLVQYVQYSKDPETGALKLFGKTGQVETDIRDWAKRNGISIQDSWVMEQVKSAATKNYDISEAKKYITNIAKRTYATHADLIDDNNTAEDAAAGYINSVQNLLEIPQGQANINDKRVQQLMKMTTDKGTAMSTYDAEKWLRKRPEWMSTKNAKETTNGIVNGVLSTFGFK